MKKLLLTPVAILVFLCGSIQKVSAQYYFYDDTYYDSPLMFEVGVSGGIMNCLTDLGGNKGIGKKFLKDLNFGNTQFGGGAYLTAMYQNKFALRVEATFGNLKAYDSVLESVKLTTMGRYERNLSFRTKISEVSLIAEFHPLFIFIDWASRDQEPPRFSPYALAGIGMFSFNPQTQLKSGKWVDLQPLHTEGQGFAEFPDRKPYKLRQMNFPVGIGFKYEISAWFNVRAEVVARILQTDYLDDVSTRYVSRNAAERTEIFQNNMHGIDLANALEVNYRNKTTDPLISSQSIRGNSKDNDAYFTANIKFGLTFGREKVRRNW